MSKKNYIGEAIATMACAAICGLLIHETHGEHGMGWFIFSLFFIW